MQIYFTQEIISCVDNKGYLGKVWIKEEKNHHQSEQKYWYAKKKINVNRTGSLLREMCL